MTADLFIRLALAALVITGVWTTFGKGMIFGWLGDIFERRLPDAINKPIWQCPPCMSSVWGTTIWFWTGGDATWYVPFVLALCGTMKLISHNLLKDA